MKDHYHELDVQFLIEQAGIKILDQRGVLPKVITGLHYHSGQVLQGMAFFCIKGYITDGHRFLASAKENGAILALVEDFQDIDIPQIRVQNSRIALALWSHLYWGRPSCNMHMVGITATNGKTSTSFMVDQIFQSAGKTTGIIGTVMTRFADQLIPSVLTTPESYDLHRYFSLMKTEGVTHVTMEVSSSGLELDRVGGVDFDIVAFNNFSAEHIDQHGSLDAYWHHKSKLIKEAKAHAWAVLNIDDARIATLVDQTQAQVFTYAVKNKDADLSILHFDLSTGRAKMTLSINRKIIFAQGSLEPQAFEVELAVAGYHSAINAMSAIAIALLSGVDISAIQAGLKAYKGVERRFEIIYENQDAPDFMVLDDHFANSGNIDVTLETMSYMHYRTLHLVYAIRGSRGVTTNSENAQTIASWAQKLNLKRIIATESLGHVGKKDLVTAAEKEVFLRIMAEANIEVVLFEGLTEAVQAGLAGAQPGDVVLLAGCQGMDFGAKIALDTLVTTRPNLTPNQVDHILAVLKDRVCGMDISELKND